MIINAVLIGIVISGIVVGIALALWSFLKQQQGIDE